MIVMNEEKGMIPNHLFYLEMVRVHRLINTGTMFLDLKFLIFISFHMFVLSYNCGLSLKVCVEVFGTAAVAGL